MTLQKNFIVLLISSWMICVLIAVFSWDLNQGTVLGHSNWFARSGSIIVLIGAFFEWRLLSRIDRHYEWVKNCSLIPQNSPHWPEADREIKQAFITPLRKAVEVSNFSLIFLGTVIWGYGDIVYQA